MREHIWAVRDADGGLRGVGMVKTDAVHSADIHEASTLATLVGGTVAPMQVRTPLERLRESLGVLQRSDLPPALLWFVEEAQQAGEELGATIRQERAK